MRSDFLFAQPSMLAGMGRVLDLWAQFDDYNASATPEEADARALFCDWAVIGQQLVGAAADTRDSNQLELQF
jgi:hypothetical protein